MRPRLKRRRGFSLIESLAAFAILALVLSQLLNGVSGGVRNESRADFLVRAARQGASQLDALGADGQIPTGETTGTYSDGLLWRLVVRPGKTVKGVTGAPIGMTFHATLLIERASGYGDNFVLSTVKLVTMEERGQ
ncbi:type II secretion system GspH family protein [Methylocystis sp. WRRC1]|uniref:type II secretion system protein n=1 Tax=Methylocystis sp. WRRC1 TaxID=1732014 RepID=UPI001D14FF75|nr:type II secretion system protein [Methylocystis sp. WRRC1]MCC3245797.1 type II secretion system GspH family protein [Methylocystis sp. WRRC1]